MSDKECFDFLKKIKYDKLYYLNKGWFPMYWWPDDPKNNPKRRCHWPYSFREEYNPEDIWIKWFPPGFKLVEDGYDPGTATFPIRSCTYCVHSKGKYSREYAYGCKLPEVRVANDSSILEGVENIAPGHSNPVFVWHVEFAPNAVCDYFEPVEAIYHI